MPVLATLEVAGGLACIALGAYYVVTLDSIVAELGMSPLSAPDFYAYFIIEGVLGGVALVLGWGIWKGKKWGLSITADFSVASMVFYVGFGSYFIAQYNDYTELMAGVVGLGVAVVAVYYLTRPKISELFSGRVPGASPDRALPVVDTHV